jgi:hypothetical protein
LSCFACSKRYFCHPKFVILSEAKDLCNRPPQSKCKGSSLRSE